MRYKFVALFLTISLLSVTAVSLVSALPAAVWVFVSPTGTGTICSESSPCSLKYGVSVKAGSGDHIIMAPGTYTADDVLDQEVLLIEKSLSIWGNCLFGSGQPVNCSFTNPASIIDGEYSRRGIKVQGGSGNAINVDINYLRVQHGSAGGIDLAECVPMWGYTVQGCGAGLFADQAGSLNIYSATFRENQASGISTTGSGASYGGGIYIQDSGDLAVTSSRFILNRAAYQGIGMGGGIYAGHLSGKVQISDVLFQANELSLDNVSSMGGGVMINDCAEVLIGDSTFHANNQSDQINAYGTAAYLRFNDQQQFFNNEIMVNWGASAVSSLGISKTYQHTFFANRFWDNATLYNLTLSGDYWAAVFNNFFHMVTPESVADRGGAVVNLHLEGDVITGSSDVDVFHNSFGAGQIGISVGDNMIADIKANILANQAYMGINVYGSVLTTIVHIDYNLFDNNYLDGDVGTHAVYADPHFVDVNMGDLHIQSASGAVDASPQFVLPYGSVDYDGDSRPCGLGTYPYDIGADERCMQGFIPFILR